MSVVVPICLACVLCRCHIYKREHKEANYLIYTITRVLKGCTRLALNVAAAPDAVVLAASAALLLLLLLAPPGSLTPYAVAFVALSPLTLGRPLKGMLSSTPNNSSASLRVLLPGGG